MVLNFWNLDQNILEPVRGLLGQVVFLLGSASLLV